MGPIGKITTVLSIALVVSVFPLAAEAQLAKGGTYASHFPWQLSVKSMALLLQNIRANKDGLIAKVLPPTSDVESDSLTVAWDIVLDKG